MNKVRYGLSNVHISKLTEKDGVYIWEKPKAMPGAKSIKLDAEGDQNIFYADDKAYYVTSTNNGYSGSLEVALLPDWFLEEYMGYVRDSKGNLVEDASAQPMPFALLFQFKGDVKAIKHCIYSVKPSRLSMGGDTTEGTTEPQTDELPFTAPPITVDGRNYVKVKTTDDTEEEVYGKWFDTAPIAPELVAETPEA